MLTFRYSKEYPEGKLFDTEGRQHPHPPPELNGWFDSPAKIHVTQDQLIDAIVRRELAGQSSDRVLAENELVKKTRMETGRDVRPSALVADKKIITALDNRPGQS